jgi:hypothetical protein
VRRVLGGRRDIIEKKMMGGLAFTIGGGMCCYLSRKGYFLVRVTPDVREQTLGMSHVKPTDFAGRRMSGFVLIEPEGMRTDTALAKWVERGIANASAMAAGKPAKKIAAKKASAKKRSRSRLRPAADGRRASPFAVAQHLYRKSPRDRTPAAQRLAIKLLDRAPCGDKRAFDAGQEVTHHALVDDELPIGAELDDQRAQQLVIRRLELDNWNHTQARGQILDLQGPASRRRARRQQQVSRLLARQVQQVKQRGLIDDRRIDILDHQRPRCECVRYRFDREISCSNRPRA